MTILIDTNVPIDFLLTRQPFYEAAAQIISRCAKGELRGIIAFHSVPNLWYILRRAPEAKRRAWLTDICSFMQVVGAAHSQVVRAIQAADFADFEDCLQDRCAAAAGAKYIVTRNVQDYKGSEVPAIEPERFCALFA